jgi:hypothetical protein
MPSDGERSADRRRNRRMRCSEHGGAKLRAIARIKIGRNKIEILPPYPFARLLEACWHLSMPEKRIERESTDASRGSYARRPVMPCRGSCTSSIGKRLCCVRRLALQAAAAPDRRHHAGTHGTPWTAHPGTRTSRSIGQRTNFFFARPSKTQARFRFKTRDAHRLPSREHRRPRKQRRCLRTLPVRSPPWRAEVQPPAAIDPIWVDMPR